MTESTSLTLSEKIETVLMKGDLSALTDVERLSYFKKVCESVGLNPLTKPFDYIVLNNKLVLYATKACTDQLRSLNKISIEISGREKIGEVYVVTARARTIDGRTDESTGVVALGKAYGDQLANLFMKAETKAKRRVTLSICGLGLLDESEVETIPGAQRAPTGSGSVKPVAQIKETIHDPKLGASFEVIGELAQIDQAIMSQAPHTIEIDYPTEGVINLSPGEVVIEYGKKFAGKKFKEFKYDEILGYIDWMKREGKDKTEAGAKFVRDGEAYLRGDEIPF